MRTKQTGLSFLAAALIAASPAIVMAQTSTTLGTGGSTAGNGTASSTLGTGGSSAGSGAGGSSNSTLGTGASAAGSGSAGAAVGTGGTSAGSDTSSSGADATGTSASGSNDGDDRYSNAKRGKQSAGKSGDCPPGLEKQGRCQ